MPRKEAGTKAIGKYTAEKAATSLQYCVLRRWFRTQQGSSQVSLPLTHHTGYHAEIHEGRHPSPAKCLGALALGQRAPGLAVPPPVQALQQWEQAASPRHPAAGLGHLRHSHTAELSRDPCSLGCCQPVLAPHKGSGKQPREEKIPPQWCARYQSAQGQERSPLPCLHTDTEHFNQTALRALEINNSRTDRSPLQKHPLQTKNLPSNLNQMEQSSRSGAVQT